MAGNKRIPGQNLNQTSFHHHVKPSTPPTLDTSKPQNAPKTSKITVPNGRNVPKQGDSCQNS